MIYMITESKAPIIPRNVILDRTDFNKILKYNMAIIGEVHRLYMIQYYDKLLSLKKPEYFICEMADMDRCYDRETLKERMDNATDGSFSDKPGCDYQYNYWVYNLAYKHNCKLIGCNLLKKGRKPFRTMDEEDKFRESYMLKTIKEFEGENAVVQIGDHHLRSIPITEEFLKYCGDENIDDRNFKVSVNDITTSSASPIFEYFKNKRNTCICRLHDDYLNEINFMTSR